MNLSGNAIADFVKDYRLKNFSSNTLILIHDDLDLPLAKIKIKRKGGDGGHRGVRSVITEIGTNEFVRFKIGIDKPKRKENIENYVLMPFQSSELDKINTAIDKVVTKVILFAITGNLSKILSSL